MKPLILFYFLVLAFTAIGQDNTQTLTLDDPRIQELLKQAQDTRSLSAGFTQEKHMQVLEEPMISQGVFKYERPGRLRWQVETPEPMVAVVNGTSVKIHEKDKLRAPSAAERQMFIAVTDLITNIISGNAMDGKEMEPAFQIEGDELFVELVPKAGRAVGRLDRINLLFNTDDMLLRELHMIQPKGDHTLILFHDARRDVEHPEGTFDLQ